MNQHLNISQSHTKEHNSISTLFLSTNSPIILDKTINNNNNISTKQTILDSKKNYIIIEWIKITDIINHNHNNIAKIKEILNITNTTSTDKQKIRSSKYKMIRSSKSIDSNEINPNSIYKGRNNNEIKKQ